MLDIKPQKIREEIFAVMRDTPLDSLTAKKVRRAVEQRLELGKGALDELKDTVTKYIDEFIKQKNEADEEDEEEVEEARPAKKAKTEGGGGGNLAPKGVKAIQARIMKGSEFTKKADQLQVTVFGNTLEGEPRTFSSGNRGWYAGKKIQVSVGDKKLWAQVGLNITIIGSKEWDE
mmetsp:Transcript_35655/g.77822  ORF Transcript_35655/g.77822 Transcript_35655/m.77822 type:complete len:175 (-) Transcript_35655:153-677(-)|eukprot:CAMPEP_0118933184 /NCGR_PEP_ID=MMETSP1169-20130426/11550_1 /TAXON_ID=36882 /ORGANISM="Pyramimonas obovata, Strain CCMP722" /LENGTH=174 /DNA_ID=CAMNT_0006875917 /DNA_START=83 /DNA_END=607 /DNA_ORIENTATION=+